LDLDVRYVSDNNPVYFDADALPAQFPGTADRITATVVYGISFGPVRLTNRLDWNTTGREEILRLPAWSWYGSAVLERNLFRSALAMHAGVAVRYQSAYNADAYMPATGRFYLQDSLTVGEYPYIDLFADFRIKATRFFIAMEHLNAGWSGYTYFLLPGYPAPGRTIKFGIVWDFAD